MSKESKFLSILADMAWKDSKDRKTAMNSTELSELLLWLKEYADANKIYCQPEVMAKEKGTLGVTVQREGGEGIVSQIRLFPRRQGEAGEPSDYLNNNSLFMYREMTDEQGELSVILPGGLYDVEITKGSEYGIIHSEILVKEGEESRYHFRLKHRADLKSLGWICGDLHHHSIYSSPVYGGTDPVVESPDTVARSMKAFGASFGALSDHHNTLNHKEWKLTEAEDFIPLISKEISTSNGHVMALGVEEDVVYRIPGDKERTDAYLKQEFIRITECIKGLGGLPQINHPRDHSRAISWNPAYNDIISCFETMEIWNGSNPMYPGTTNDEAFGFWRELLEKGIFLPAVTGSDTHNIRANDYTAYFAKMKWLEGLIRNRELKLPKELSGQVKLFLSLAENELKVFEKWAKSNLSSGGVRTYVYVEGKIDTLGILDSLRKGRSFLTNGPILIPSIEGIIPGGVVDSEDKPVDIEIKLMSNRPLDRLYLYTNGGRKEEISLPHFLHRECREKLYDCSRTISSFPTKGVKWLFLQAESDCTNMAITNPIFFRKPKEL